MERPFLEAIEFALTIATTFDHRSASVSEVATQPLFAQHPDKCGQQRYQKTRVKKVYGCDDLGGGTIPHWEDNVLARGKGSVEGKENRSEVCFRPFAGVWFEFGLDVDGEGGTDGGE